METSCQSPPGRCQGHQASDRAGAGNYEERKGIAHLSIRQPQRACESLSELPAAIGQAGYTQIAQFSKRVPANAPMTGVETAEFLKHATRLMSDSERAELVAFVGANPEAGEIMPEPMACGGSDGLARVWASGASCEEPVEGRRFSAIQRLANSSVGGPCRI